MIDQDLAAELDGLAQAIARMRPPMSSNPEAFHEDRSELASRARALALRARTGKVTAAADVPAPSIKPVFLGSRRKLRVVYMGEQRIDWR